MLTKISKSAIISGQSYWQGSLKTFFGRRARRCEMQDVGSLIIQLARELTNQIGIDEQDTETLLSDPAIENALRRKAEEQIKSEKKVAEEAAERVRREKILAAKKALGLVKPPALSIVPKVSKETRWEQYLKEKPANFLPAIFYSLTDEEISAARGALIAVLQRHRRNPSWVEPKMAAAVDIFEGKAQAFLNKINAFFKGEIPRASREVFGEIFPLLKKEPQLKWFFDGQEAVYKNQEKERQAKERAAAQEEERRQKEAASQALAEYLAKILGEIVPPELAEKMAATVAKKFPESSSAEEALGRMAISHQVDAILKEEGFLKRIAPEAEPYALAACIDEQELIEQAKRNPEVIALLKRKAKNFGEMKIGGTAKPPTIAEGSRKERRQGRRK